MEDTQTRGEPVAAQQASDLILWKTNQNKSKQQKNPKPVSPSLFSLTRL